MIKRQLGYVKTRFRGLAKNTAQLVTLFALSNLWMARRHFVFLNRTRNQVNILYWHRNGFYLWLKRLEAQRFKTKPHAGDDAIELTVRELNLLLDGIDLWGNQPHKVLTPRFAT